MWFHIATSGYTPTLLWLTHFKAEGVTQGGWQWVTLYEGFTLVVCLPTLCGRVISEPPRG